MSYIIETLGRLVEQTAFLNLTVGNLIMIAVACVFLYLAINRGFEPLLLVPIAFGMLLVNIYPDIMLSFEDAENGTGGLLYYFYKLDEWSILPSLIFMGVGAMTDFRPLIANPKSFLLGAAAQFGIFAAYLGAMAMGFSDKAAAAIAINNMKRVPRTIVMGITNIPMLNADIVTGISLMLAFIAFGISLGFKTILIAHITFNIPYVILSVMPKLKQTDKSTYEAAMDLGATPVYAFFKVVFPDILPGVLSGFLLAFTMSLDDFIITHFTKGPGIDTLSTKIYTEVKKGIKPEMYALSTLIFVAVLLLLLLVNKAPSKREKAA